MSNGWCSWASWLVTLNYFWENKAASGCTKWYCYRVGDSTRLCNVLSFYKPNIRDFQILSILNDRVSRFLFECLGAQQERMERILLVFCIRFIQSHFTLHWSSDIFEPFVWNSSCVIEEGDVILSRPNFTVEFEIFFLGEQYSGGVRGIRMAEQQRMQHGFVQKRLGRLRFFPQKMSRVWHDGISGWMAVRFAFLFDYCKV